MKREFSQITHHVSRITLLLFLALAKKYQFYLSKLPGENRLSLTENEIQSRLLSFYEREFPSRENTQISNLTKITDGWENEVYSFTIEYEGASERKHEDLILRIYPGNDAPQKSAREFNAMKQLREIGFPVPEVLLLELDSSSFGKPFPQYSNTFAITGSIKPKSV